MKRVLVLGAGSFLRRALERIRASGRFEVYAVDRDPTAPGACAAHEFAPADITDVSAVLRVARKWRVDGVLAVNDFGTRTAAAVAGELGLPGITAEAAHAANDKGAMRDVWAAAGLPQPRYAIVAGIGGARDALESAVGYPAVMKPTDCGGGGRGVSIVSGPADVEWSWRHVEPFAGNGRVIVEEMVDGPELTIESITIDGAPTLLAMSDKHKPELRTRVATSLHYPAAISADEERAVGSLVGQAVAAIGVTVGMAHTEVILSPDGPRLVELGARGGGGHIFHTIIPAVTGVDAPVAAAALAVGEGFALPPVGRRGAVYRFLQPPPGVLREATGLAEAAALPGVLDVGLIRSPGDVVGGYGSSMERTGFVVTEGATREAAIARADAAEAVVTFCVDPLPVEAGGRPLANGPRSPGL